MICARLKSTERGITSLAGLVAGLRGFGIFGLHLGLFGSISLAVPSRPDLFCRAGASLTGSS